MALDIRQYAARVRLTDGAWGTQLQKRGLAPGQPPELWNADNAAAVATVAESYVQAGSDVIITNTFGANRFVLERHGAAARASELAQAGVRISRQAADAGRRGVKVFASLGPSGKIVMMGEVEESRFGEAFAEAARGIEDGGADAIVLESFAELAEARLAIRAVRAACRLPVVACMTFSAGPNGTATMMGNTPAELVLAAVEDGADAVGANCGIGPDNYVKVAALLRSATDLPIWIKANAGLPAVGADGRTTFPMGPADFASFVPALVAAGANFIGGCCGTTPDHIRMVRAAIDRLSR